MLQERYLSPNFGEGTMCEPKHALKTVVSVVKQPVVIFESFACIFRKTLLASGLKFMLTSGVQFPLNVKTMVTEDICGVSQLKAPIKQLHSNRQLVNIKEHLI